MGDIRPGGQHSRRAMAFAVAVVLVLAGCKTSATPTPTPTPTAPPAQAPADQAATPALSLPWLSTGPDGQPLKHPWTGGPHGELDGQLCLPEAPCASSVPKLTRSGLDFGAGGGDWDVYPVAAGTLLYKGPLTGGYGAGVVIDHGGLVVIYAHMDEASLADAPAAGLPVDRATKLGKTWCTGMQDAQGRPACSAASGNHHLHLELRTGTQATEAGVTAYGTAVTWDGRTIGGWTITAGTLNYNGTATACGGTPLAASANTPPSLYDATTCATSPTPTPTATPTPTPTPTLAPVLSGTWVSPKAGATVKTLKLTLSAKPTASLTDVTLTKVVYSVAWGSKAPTTACTATKAATDGTWSCTADLAKLAASLGKLTLSFDVFDDAGDVARAAGGKRTVLFAALPGAPISAESAYSPPIPVQCQTNPSAECLRTGFEWKSGGGLVDGYRLYTRKADITSSGIICSGPYKSLVSLPRSATTYASQSPALGGVGFCYYIEAFNGAGQSPRVLFKDVTVPY